LSFDWRFPPLCLFQPQPSSDRGTDRPHRGGTGRTGVADSRLLFAPSVCQPVRFCRCAAGTVRQRPPDLSEAPARGSC
jgi:hypothetical protein